MHVPANTPLLTSAAMRDAELEAVAKGVSLSVLMDRAGAAVADLAWRMASGSPILVLVGPGNNGGDGYVAAQLLKSRGANVRVAALAPPSTDLARAACADWTGDIAAINEDLQGAPVIVDALFGIGLSRPVADELRAILQRIPDATSRLLAVDVPSGVESDGQADWTPPLRADVTLALGALKPAHVLIPAAPHCGEVHIASLGMDTAPTMHSLPKFVDERAETSANKFSRGMVLVRAGTMAGAAGLASGGAMRAGAGYVVLNGAGEGPMAAIIAEPDEAFTGRLADHRLGAIVIGPGYHAGDRLDADVAAVIEAGRPAVFDAAAIMAALPSLTAKAGRAAAILTPHAGEFARAFPGLQGSKIDRARAAAVKAQAVIIYKGADTIIAAPDGRIAAAWPGSPLLATAGSGDVLAGACGAMMARGMDAFDAAEAAVGWHIARARQCGPGLVADDLVG